MKKLIIPILMAATLGGCTPHGKGTPFSKWPLFSNRATAQLENASRQASLAKSPQQALSYYETVYNKYNDEELVAVAYAKALRTSGFPARSIKVLDPHYGSKKVSQEAVIEYIKAHIAAGDYIQAQQLAQARIIFESGDAQKDAKEEYLESVRQARIQKMIEPERPAFNTHQGDPELHNLLGIIYDAQGESEKAEAELRSALSRWQGDRGLVENNLALALAHQGKLEQAMTMISKAFVSEPDRPQIARNLEIIGALYKNK